jgi:hypothetical protein
MLAAPIKAIAAATPVAVVMSGLDNPRGLAFGPQGALYVVEGGRGGSGPCLEVRGPIYCYGTTGAVTRLWKGEQERVITGLPSLGRLDGSQTIGPSDISMVGVGEAFVTVGFEMDPARRAELGDAGRGFARVLRVLPSGDWNYVADVGAYETAVNPDGNTIVSNPYGILAEPGARILTDAAGNALIRIAADGDISTLAVFPSKPARPFDSVPTSVAVGPDGAYYVGELSGFPFFAGAANVYRVDPGEAPQVYLAGFKTIIDIAFGPDGSLYVLQYASGPTTLNGPGALLRIEADGTRMTVLDGLDHPTSVAVGANGAIYISNRGIFAGSGEVLRVAE